MSPQKSLKFTFRSAPACSKCIEWVCNSYMNPIYIIIYIEFSAKELALFLDTKKVIT